MYVMYSPTNRTVRPQFVTSYMPPAARRPGGPAARLRAGTAAASASAAWPDLATRGHAPAARRHAGAAAASASAASPDLATRGRAPGGRAPAAAPTPTQLHAPALEPDIAHYAHLQREPDPHAGPLRRGAGMTWVPWAASVKRALGEPDDAAVLGEMVV
jgi:hypothetical protein